MSKVIRISESTEKYLNQWRQAAEAEEKITGERAYYEALKEKDDFAIKAALLTAINYQINYLKRNGIDIVIKKE